MYGYVLCHLSLFPIIENIAHTLSFTVLVISCMIHPYYISRLQAHVQNKCQAEEVRQVFFLERSHNNTFCPQNMLFLPIFHHSKRCLMAFGASYTLETGLQWKLDPCFLLSFYNNIKMDVNGVISCISGGISFSGFPDEAFSKIQWGLGTIGWGFSKTDGVLVGLAESQCGCLESQWGRLLVGMLHGPYL